MLYHKKKYDIFIEEIRNYIIMNLLEQLICWWKVQNLKKAWTGTGERAKEI
jgi:hypothetical protein